MNIITHGIFSNAFHKEMRNNYDANQNQEILILGAVQLYWKNSKNIAYLNQAMQYARGRRGIRVNAVKAFIVNFTGAVYKQGSDFTKAGRKMKEIPEGFEKLSSWLEWADVHVQEPEYNLGLQQLKVISFLQAQKKVAMNNNQLPMVDMLNESIISYAEANKQVIEAKAG